MSTRKINVAFATVWFVYWSRKEMRFLFIRKPSSRTPAEAGQTPGRRTVNTQEGPSPGAGPHELQPLGLWRPSCFPGLSSHCTHTQSLFNPSRRTEEFIFTRQRARFSHPPRGGDPDKRPFMDLDGQMGMGPMGWNPRT